MSDFEKAAVVAVLICFFIYKILEWLEKQKTDKIFKENNSELELIRASQIGKSAPAHVAKSLNDYIGEFRSSGLIEWNDFSPLTCFGYRAGKTNGKSEVLRREIIIHTWYAEIPSIIPRKYAMQWGSPGTYMRFDKIRSHLIMLARQRQGRKNYEAAVEHWMSDAKWFFEMYGELAYRYKAYGFSN